MENEKKEQGALVVGSFLILLVIVITLFRSDLFNDADPASDSDSQSSEQGNSLGYKTINAKDLQKKILITAKNETVRLLDARPFDSYIREHITDAINITADDYPISSKIDAHDFVVVIGEDATDENISKTVVELKKENFSNFLVLAGGMDTWKQIIGATVTYGDPNLFTDQAKVSYTDPEKINEALTQKIPMFIVDVRSSDEYAKGHIPGAKNIPVDELEKRRSEISEKKVVVVGINELQEFQASVQMYDMLLVSPFVMRGAMPKWQEKGFPMIK